ncbi:MAG: hypothetical protein MJE63_08795 [Proteobacteria bacterium]|nr:hypothetical protein [Pseudomonadota bacterium]
MKSFIKLFFILTISLSFGQVGLSQNQNPKYTANEIYTYFQSFSPNDIVDFTKSAANLFAVRGSELSNLSKSDEETLAGQLLKEFQMNAKEFDSINTVFHPYVVLLRCDQSRIVAHPIKEFFVVMSQPGFIKIYKDVNGKKIGVDLCEKLARSKSGVWGFQKQWWPLTDKPLTMGVYTMNIPGTVYQLQSYYPTIKYNEIELNETLE